MKTTPLFFAILAGFALAACSSGDGSTGSTTGVTTDGYYNLLPGQCGEFSNDGGGGGPTVGLKILASGTGILLQRTKHGTTKESDYLAIDAGQVFLLNRDLQGTQQAFVTPLAYLPVPPLDVGGGTLNTTSACSGGSNCATMNLAANTASSRTYAGPLSTSDAGLTEYKINFVFTSTLADGGTATETDETWITPGIGFTDLFLESDTPGTFTDYVLVDIVTDGGPCALH